MRDSLKELELSVQAYFDIIFQSLGYNKINEYLNVVRSIETTTRQLGKFNQLVLDELGSGYQTLTSMLDLIKKRLRKKANIIYFDTSPGVSRELESIFSIIEEIFKLKDMGLASLRPGTPQDIESEIRARARIIWQSAISIYLGRIKDLSEMIRKKIQRAAAPYTVKEELEAEIITVHRGKSFTNSLVYTKEFEFIHKNALNKIRKLIAEYKALRSEFRESTFINDRNREYPYFEMTRDGYTTLIMQMGGAKNKKSRDLIFAKQQLFIKAFNKMEQVLLQKSNTEWVTERKQGKIARRAETDTIKEFIDYAMKQGASSGAKFYYKNITNATYKALTLIEQKKPKTRETLDVLELHQLYLAENIVQKVIQKEMEANEHYKVIYEKAKDALIAFAGTLYIG